MHIVCNLRNFYCMYYSLVMQPNRYARARPRSDMLHWHVERILIAAALVLLVF